MATSRARHTLLSSLLVIAALCALSIVARAQSTGATTTGATTTGGDSADSPPPGRTVRGPDGKWYEHASQIPALKDPGGSYPTDPGVSIPVPEAPKLPEGPLPLRYKLDEKVSYLVRGTSRMAVRDREDMKQIYTSAIVVDYEPVALKALPATAWRSPQGAQDAQAAPPSPDETRVLLSTRKAVGRFKRPVLFGEPERTHQIMRQAHLSYKLDPRGKVSDVRVHVPTHPLARGTLAQTTRMAELMQPVFPARPIGPGDTWTQELIYRDGEGIAKYSQDTVNTYTFKKWTPCRDTVCAMIEIKQEMKSAGRMVWRAQETRGTSLGGGEGLLLFDPHAGQVVKTLWKLKGQGNVKALQAVDGKPVDGKAPTKTLADADVIVEVEITAERVER